MTPEQEQSMLDAANAMDIVLAEVFGVSVALDGRRKCERCGDTYEHPDPEVKRCAECICGGQTCEWRIVKSTTDEDGNTFGVKQCFTEGCGKRNEFQA